MTFSSTTERSVAKHQLIRDASGKIPSFDLKRAIDDGIMLEPLVKETISGDLDLDSASYSHKLVIRDCTFEGNVICREARFERSLDLRGCTFQRALNLAGASIRGSLDMRGATLNEAPQPSHVRAVDPPDVWLADFSSLHVTGELSAGGIQAHVTVSLDEARIDGPCDFSSTKERRTFLGRDLFAPGLAVGGQMNLLGIEVGGQLQLQGTRIGKDLFCRPYQGYGVQIHKHVSLAGATVAGQLHLSGARIGGSVLLHGAKVTEDVFLEPFHDAEFDLNSDVHVIDVGEIHLRDLDVAGQISLDGLHVRGEVDLRGVKCAELSCVGWPSSPSETWGKRTGIRPRIMGTVRLSGCTIGRLMFDGRMCANTGPDLSLATVTVLEIVQSLCAAPNLQGLSFEELILPDGRKPIELVSATCSFKKSTYSRFEKWLRDRGHDDEADEMYLEMRRRNRKFGMTLGSRVTDWLLDVSIRYGIKPYRIVFALLALLVVSFWVLTLPAGVARKPLPAGSERSAIDPTTGDKFWVAFRVTVPVVTVFAADEWRPSAARIDFYGVPLPLRYEQFASAVSVLSWILVPLFLAGITGLAKRR